MSKSTKVIIGIVIAVVIIGVGFTLVQKFTGTKDNFYRKNPEIHENNPAIQPDMQYYKDKYFGVPGDGGGG